MRSLIFAVALFGFSASAQSIFHSTSVSVEGDTIKVTIGQIGRIVPRLNIVTGAPYTADQVSEHTQTLFDGTHIAQNHTIEHVARDSQGRTRTERPLMIGPMSMTTDQNAHGPMLIEIHDPLAGYAYVLDDQNKIAHRVAIQSPGENRAPVKRAAPAAVNTTAYATAPPRPERSEPENLGTQTIEGVAADGVRRTTTWPIGSRGNDRPIVETSENWSSPELKLLLLEKTSSPLIGENITRYANLSRAEPDPSVFQPAGYAIFDEKDSFEMILKRP
jgi:hypothetical protein